MICNHKRLGFSLLLTSAALMPFSLQVFATVDLRIRPEMFAYEDVECYYAEGYGKFVMDIWPWLDFCLYAFVPLVFIFVSNVIILSFLWKASMDRKKLSFNRVDKNAKVKAAGTSSKMKSLTAMLLSRTLAFLILIFPFSVYSIGITKWQKSRDLRYHEKLYLVHTVSVLLAYLAHATNFFLYCASGPQFRKAAKEMFCPTVSRNYSSACNSNSASTAATNLKGSPVKKLIENTENTEKKSSESLKHNAMTTCFCTETDISDNRTNDLLDITSTDIKDKSNQILDDNVNMTKESVVSENEVLINVNQTSDITSESKSSEKNIVSYQQPKSSEIVTNANENRNQDMVNNKLVENVDSCNSEDEPKVKTKSLGEADILESKQGAVTHNDESECTQGLTQEHTKACRSFDNPAYCTEEFY